MDDDDFEFQANVSEEELERKYQIYLRSVEQTKRAEEVKKQFLEEHSIPRSIVKHMTVMSKHERHKRSLKDVNDDGVEFLHFNRSSVPVQRIIEEAKLELTFTHHETPHQCRVTVTQLIADDDGIVLDTASIENNIVDLDISHAVQAWSWDASDRNILKLQFQNCPRNTETIFNIKYSKPKQRRSKRSLHTSSRLNQKHKHRKTRRRKLCRKKTMEVDLDKLGGFDFIVMPRYFNAALCSGKCPPRYKPAGDHSLLQSLLSLHSRHKDVPAPCCSPSHYHGLDVLHLDDGDNTKLKVTNWKNVVVSSCSCA